MWVGYNVLEDWGVGGGMSGFRIGPVGVGGSVRIL
jgi:hypothetical protein